MMQSIAARALPVRQGPATDDEARTEEAASQTDWRLASTDAEVGPSLTCAPTGDGGTDGPGPLDGADSHIPAHRRADGGKDAPEGADKLNGDHRRR